MKIISPVFENNQKIPSKFTCDGENINPPLKTSDVPSNARSMVLIVDDPDAPGGTWVHWVVYNINPKVKEIATHSIPQGGIQADSSFGKPEYGGPCPPSGTHHYFFKLYALDKKLIFSEPVKADKKQVEEKMQGHVIDSAELVGVYKRGK